MEHGAWSMEHGAWSMEHGAWSMEHGARSPEPGAKGIELGVVRPPRAELLALSSMLPAPSSPLTLQLLLSGSRLDAPRIRRKPLLPDRSESDG